MEISEILSKYDTDKEKVHHYGSSYKEIFSRYKRGARLNILEVGTQKGGSLLAWKEYFPNANVYGVDILDVVPDEYRKDTVTRVISDIKDWKNDMKWDIVIDDGSHYLLDVAYVIAHYSLKLKRNGVVIVEDVRIPQLLELVIENLFNDIRIICPILETKVYFNIKRYNTTAYGTPNSMIFALFKESL